MPPPDNPTEMLAAHLVHLAEKLRAGADPRHVFRDSITEGPVDPNVIRYRGRECSLEPQAYRLFRYVWEHGRGCPVDDALWELWGRDDGDSALRNSKARVNQALEATGAPYRLRLKAEYLKLA